MPRFSYTAKSQSGVTKSGFLEAKDEQELANFLRQEGLFLISAQTKELSQGNRASIFSFQRGVSVSDKLFFIRNLRVMTVAGVSLPRAIETLSAQAQNQRLKKALAEIGEKVVHGQTLSEGLREYPDIFPEIFQNMVKVGEESGTLEQVLKNLSQQLEKQQELRSKIVGAMVYPMVVVSAMIGIGFLMLIIIVPQLAETFAELELSLPFTTQIVIGLGTFLRTRWYLLPLIILGAVFSVRGLSRTQVGKQFLDKIFLKIPVLSRLVKETAAANFTRTLSSLISSGVPLVRSLEIIAGTLNNIYFRNSLLEAAEKVRKGARLSESLKPYESLYPPLVVQMIEVGEETGETSQILEQLATFLEDEVANTTKNLASLIEPLLMLAVGGAVGFFAISMIQPMYSMLEAL
ncbi:MAG: type II secretion system F family protein [Candidatus Nealsonbacteria bacterium]|nr:type II secretion system F family protein [Candidatus Nealsonbacteria bacterium]